jgi:hypothetical protein
MAVIEGVCRVVGGVDTHKDLHVAAIADEQDRIIGTRSFATTRQGYRQMLAWTRSFGELQRRPDLQARLQDADLAGVDEPAAPDQGRVPHRDARVRLR